MWLFVPPEDMTKFEASAFAPASAASILDFTSQSPDTALFVLSNDKPSARPFSWRGWRTRAFVRHLSGTICAPSMATRGVAAFISSLPAIHASRSHIRDTAKVATTPGTFGLMSPVWSERSRHDGFSLKTCQGICPSVSTTSSDSFRTWASGLLRASHRRLKQAGRTSGNGCSFWATPTARSAGNRAAIRLSDQGLRFLCDENQTGSQIGLKNQAVAWCLLWQLMKAFEVPTGQPRSSHPDRVILLSGEKYSGSSLSLNPAFADWMMGWPIGWSDAQRPVTGWSHWLRRARGSLLERL